MTPQELRNSILQLAIQGKLVEQRPEEGTAEELYREIQKEKQALIKAGKIKKEKALPEITEDEVPFEIPGSWKWVRIGQVFALQAGKNITSSNISESKTTERPYLCYGGNGIRGYVSSYNNKGNYMIIGRQGALCGNVNYAQGEFYATEHAVVVNHFKLSDVIWCGYFLKALNLNQYSTATAQPGLSVANIIKVLIPLPPLAEQKRIVARIEELMPLVDRYEKAWSRLEGLNRRFPDDLQKSILQMAIQGKLVEQRPEEGTAEELHQQIQAEKQALIKAGKIKKEKPLPEIAEEEIPFEIPGSWKWVKVGNIGSWSAGATPSRTNEEYYNGNIPWLKTGDLNDGYISKTSETISELALAKTSVRLNPAGSVLMAMYGATIGKLGILEIEATTNQACCACIPYKGMYNLFLFYFLLAMRKNYVKMGEGGAQPNISKDKIVNSLIPLPPVSEQKRIVAKIEEFLQHYKSLQYVNFSYTST